MREIKFRAWFREMMSKPFLIGEGVCWPNGSVSTANKIGVIMQYTGLKDVNGVEIYEGDIVVNKLGRVCKIEWNEYQGCWDSLFIRDNCKNNEIDKSVGFKNRDFKYHVQLIGNIYENPELLKEITPN